MSIRQTNYEDQRNVSVPAGTVVQVSINGVVVYDHVVSPDNTANITFQLQEINEEIIE